MTRWLLKTEPSTYSWADLVRDGKTTWDGVANPTALKPHPRDEKRRCGVHLSHRHRAADCGRRESDRATVCRSEAE